MSKKGTYASDPQNFASATQAPLDVDCKQCGPSVSLPSSGMAPTQVKTRRAFGLSGLCSKKCERLFAVSLSPERPERPKDTVTADGAYETGGEIGMAFLNHTSSACRHCS